jgi:phosphoribosylaminoimidazolecarboxamide formyltransferase / IMP cyclohydrolase
VTDVADLTGYPAILGHRVVTLHPAVHGGLLADPSLPEHAADLEAHGIRPFDLLVVNLYPFARQPSVEMIDVGGPAMVRAAAKNHARVGVVVDPADYEPVLAELRAARALSPDTRRRLARAAFAHTAAYDAAVVAWFDETAPEPSRRCRPPSTCRSSTCRRSATARTRTSRAPGTAWPGPPAGGTAPCSTAARS